MIRKPGQLVYNKITVMNNTIIMYKYLAISTTENRCVPREKLKM